MRLGLDRREAARLHAPGGAEEEHGSQPRRTSDPAGHPPRPPSHFSPAPPAALRPPQPCAPRAGRRPIPRQPPSSPRPREPVTQASTDAAAGCRWGCQGVGERQPLAPPVAGGESCYPIGSHSWSGLPKGWFISLHWLRRRTLFIPLAASANSTIFFFHSLGCFYLELKFFFHWIP